jgi:hypothetical protein
MIKEKNAFMLQCMNRYTVKYIEYMTGHGSDIEGIYINGGDFKLQLYHCNQFYLKFISFQIYDLVENFPLQYRTVV